MTLQQVGRFAVRDTIGEGAMGQVYLAMDPTLQRLVAIKVLRPEFSADPTNTARLLREAQAMARLAHPNVVTVYEAGQIDDAVFIAMERVDGQNVRAWRLASQPSLDEIIEVFRQAALGLAAAHDVGMVHRDVKPDNLLLGHDGRVRITDFGLVSTEFTLAAGHAPSWQERSAEDAPPSLTWTGALLGTPPYMAPEAHRFLPQTPASDQFSFCVSLWETVTGKRPYRGATLQALATNIIEGKREGGELLPPGVLAIVERGLAAEPSARWPSMRELAAALGALHAKVQVPEQADMVASRDPMGQATTSVASASALAAAANQAPAGSELAVDSQAAPMPTARTIAQPRTRWLVAAGLAAVGVGALGRRVWQPDRRPAASTTAAAATSASGQNQLAEPAALGVPASAPPQPDAKPPGAALVPRTLPTTTSCPYMPVFDANNQLYYDDGIGDVYRLDLVGKSVPVIATTANDWRVARGVTPGQMHFVGMSGGKQAVGTVDVSTGELRYHPLALASIATGGGTLFGIRSVAPEVWRIVDREAKLLFTMPSGYRPYALAASADGRRLVITTSNQRSVATICVADLTAAPIALAAPVDCWPDAAATLGRATISADGATIYYQTAAGIRRRTVGTNHDELWLAGADGYGGMDIALDGRTLAYSTARPTTELRHGDTGEVVLRELATAAVASQDGRWFFTRRTPTGQIEIVEKLGDNLRVLHTGAAIGRIEVTPDGSELVFEDAGPNGGISVLATAGFAPERITTNPADAGPAWHNGTIIFTRYDANGAPWLHSVDPRRGPSSVSKKPLLAVPRETMAGIAGTGEVLIKQAGQAAVMAWHPTTGRMRRIASPLLSRTGTGIASPDGQWYYGPTQDVDALVKVPIENGPRDARQAAVVYRAKPCGLVGWAAVDYQGQLYVQERMWRGELKVVPLTSDSIWAGQPVAQPSQAEPSASPR